MSGFFRGTSLDQDSRFGNKKKKLLASMSFPRNFSEKVDMSKVNKEVMNKWITERITELLGFEDEIVVSLAINQLETAATEKLDPREIQIALTGFLEKKTPVFVSELWTLLLSAQSNSTGIPTEFLERKKEELRKKKEADTKAAEAVRRKIVEMEQRAGPDGRSGNRSQANGRNRETSRPAGRDYRDRSRCRERNWIESRSHHRRGHRRRSRSRSVHSHRSRRRSRSRSRERRRQRSISPRNRGRRYSTRSESGSVERGKRAHIYRRSLSPTTRSPSAGGAMDDGEKQPLFGEQKSLGALEQINYDDELEKALRAKALETLNKTV